MKTNAHKIIISLLCFIMSLMLFSAACAAGEEDALPTSYNGYELGKLPAIRDQGDYDSGWAFAAIAAVEADLIHDGIADNDKIDLSELHLAYFANHGFIDEKGLNTGDTITINEGINYLNAGKNNDKAPLALFNMLGPVQESDVPYDSAPEYSPNPATGRTGDYQITGFYHYSSESYTDNDWVKSAIMKHGAVTAAYYDNNEYYNDTYHSYYYPGESEPNHVITIVGWDDNFPKSNFKSTPLRPPGDGAWLIRNSRGVDNYSHNGYFWLSYYDTSLSQKKYAFDVQEGRFDHVYSYDNCPGTDYSGASSSDKVVQTFFADVGEQIMAFGFYTPDTNLELSFAVSSGEKRVTQSVTTTDAGYYLIPLMSPMKLSDSGKVTIDYFISNSDKVSYEQGPYDEGNGITYNSGTGSEGLVIGGENTGYDGRIKLFTNDLPQTTAVTILDQDRNEIIGGTKMIRTASYQLHGATEPDEALQEFNWTSSDETIAEVVSSGNVSFKKAGKVTITAAALDGSGKSAAVAMIYVTNDMTLILPSELTDIGPSAFEGSTGFHAVILPDGVKTIGSRAFAGCSNLWLVYIPDSVSSIADDAFSWNSDLNFVCESEAGAGADYARTYNIPYQIGF